MVQLEVANLLGDLLAHGLRFQVGHQIGDQLTVGLGLEIADLFGLLDGGFQVLVVAHLFAGLHAAVVGGADLAGLLGAPGLGLRDGAVVGVSGVASRLEPSLANHLWLFSGYK